MENNQSSITALVTAYSRAYHSLNVTPKIFDDFLARQLFSNEEWGFFTRSIAGTLKFFDPGLAASVSGQEEALEWVMKIQNAPVTLSRSRYNEDTLEAEIEHGVTQYVILGAGFDTFAFRRPDILEHLKVFEVDHPATQAFKVKRISELGWELPPKLHLLPLDFSRDSLETLSGYSPYDTKALSLFSWLGVTYYLTREVIFDTLRTLSSIAPSGSSIVFDYFDADAFVSDKASKRVRLMQEVVRQAGEPMKTGFDPNTLSSELKNLGLKLVENMAPQDIEKRYFSGRSDGYHAFELVHFAKAVVV